MPHSSCGPEIEDRHEDSYAKSRTLIDGGNAAILALTLRGDGEGEAIGDLGEDGPLQTRLQPQSAPSISFTHCKKEEMASATWDSLAPGTMKRWGSSLASSIQNFSSASRGTGGSLMSSRGSGSSDGNPAVMPCRKSSLRRCSL